MHWVTVLILFLATTAYLLIGAAVFEALESNNEQKPKYKISDLLENASFTAENTSFIDKKKIEVFVLAMVQAYDQGLLDVNVTKSEEKWNYMSALCFCITVITTVGYGNIAPSTPGGQLFCIFYALIGIPVNGVLLIQFGRKISAPIKKFRNRSKTRYKRIINSIAVFTVGTAVMIFIPAFVHRNTEGWTLLESVYFSVITFTTIGFGDYVVDYEKLKYSEIYQLLNHLWIFIGLAWASAALSDVSDHFTAGVEKREASVRRASRRISTTENNSGPETTQRLNYI
ncbi:potassium channel subfamily K member 10-like [Mercenaria mercenaria]|uniref:potassium channel subfamily K member 10-like n=1 Tax=Mercenaria mercenaria TaxID=6596 RepID=UPI00234F23E1|nr:potassium channel subfamily K member 10-like [Mercenaria mercenaria]